MRKLTVLLMVLGLALMVTPALAVGLGPNELVNGDFGTGDLTGWSTLAGHPAFTNVFPTVPPPALYSAGSGTLSDVEYGMYQIIDESTQPGWLANGAGKQWRVDLDVATYGLASAELHLLYFPTNGGAQPVLTEVGDAFPGWNLLQPDVFFPSTNGAFTHFTFSGEVVGFQPQWVAYVLELTIPTPGFSSFGAFTNNDFEARCVVPVPPAVWLFGSGLVGLFGLRRKFGK